MDFDKASQVSLSQIHSGDAMEAIRNPAKQYESALGEPVKGIEMPKNGNAELKWDSSAPVTVTVPTVQEEMVDSLNKSLVALSLPVKAIEASAEIYAATVGPAAMEEEPVEVRSCLLMVSSRSVSKL